MAQTTMSLSQLQNELAKELGEASLIFKARSWKWARKQLKAGLFVARHTWRLHSRPKPLYMHLEGKGASEVLMVRWEVGPSDARANVATLTWSDLNECDWYLVQGQLELVR